MFLVTGFADAPEEKAAVLRALREGGATLAEAVPEPAPAPGAPARRASAGGRALALQPAVTAVVSDRRIRTPKYLYAIIRCLPVLKPAWVLACAKARQQVRPAAGDACLRAPPLCRALLPGNCCCPSHGPSPLPALALKGERPSPPARLALPARSCP